MLKQKNNSNTNISAQEILKRDKKHTVTINTDYNTFKTIQSNKQMKNDQTIKTANEIRLEKLKELKDKLNECRISSASQSVDQADGVDIKDIVFHLYEIVQDFVDQQNNKEKNENCIIYLFKKLIQK